jgi:hypothetical protein
MICHPSQFFGLVAAVSGANLDRIARVSACAEKNFGVSLRR